MVDTHAILKQYWGYDRFRPLQQPVIDAVLARKDVLALMPTGGGKSVCFQVPALAQEGICLVISPLIALMKDQVENLRKRGILALAIYSGLSRRHMVQTLKNAAHGPYKFLYVSPERLETDLFLEYLPALDINLIAVDEAHCISQWGYDFRPSYLRIAELRTHLPDIPVLALTASATKAVQQDICDKLLFNEGQIFQQSFERKNLSYSVFNVPAKITKLTEILTRVPGTAIVYCNSRRRTAEIQQLLHMQGITAHSYHAGLLPDERNKRQQDWMENKVKVMVCTNAFGMGIDKPDVRTVVHMDIPDCLENYYQEAGRSGRDEKKAYAVLLYTDKDIHELEILHTKRFPTFAEIKQVYQALVNYLQIPLHSGQDVSYTFHFEPFVKNFKLDAVVALYALKALESDGWIYFNEKNFMPSTVAFTTSKQHLYEFEKSYPQYEELLTALLRTYEGIFDFPAYISENLLARLLRKEEPEIKKLLQEAASFAIIQYAPQNDAPQVVFRKRRVAADDLTMDLTLYHKRKDQFISRAAQMVQYAFTAACRSRFISTYFGDATAKACGICDTCLRRNSLPMAASEFDQIKNLIFQQLTKNALAAPQLLATLGSIKKEKAWKVLEFLQAENKITVDSAGLLVLT